MVTKYIETDKDAQEFANYIRSKGGEVQQIKALRQGYEFAIIKPDNVAFDPTWGYDRMKEFLSGKTE